VVVDSARFRVMKLSAMGVVKLGACGEGGGRADTERDWLETEALRHFGSGDGEGASRPTNGESCPVADAMRSGDKRAAAVRLSADAVQAVTGALHRSRAARGVEPGSAGRERERSARQMFDRLVAKRYEEFI
jgi:hypothetical protein